MHRDAPFYVLLLAAALLAVAMPATADCGDYAENLLASENCDADLDAGVLTSDYGSVSHDSSEGIPPGAFRIESEDDKGEVVTVNLCGGDTTQQLFSVSVALKRVAGGALDCFLQVESYSAQACGGALFPSNSLQPTIDSSDWEVFTFSEDTLVAGLSADVRVECSSDGPFTLLIDNLYLVEGHGGAPLFFDGFEDGDLEHW